MAHETPGPPIPWYSAKHRERESQEQIMLRNFARRDSPSESVIRKIGSFLTRGKHFKDPGIEEARRRDEAEIDEAEIERRNRLWKSSIMTPSETEQLRLKMLRDTPLDALKRRALTGSSLLHLGSPYPEDTPVAEPNQSSSSHPIGQRPSTTTKPAMPLQSQPFPQAELNRSRLSDDARRAAAAAQQLRPPLRKSLQVNPPPEGQTPYPREYYTGGRGNYPAMSRSFRTNPSGLGDIHSEGYHRGGGGYISPMFRTGGR